MVGGGFQHQECSSHLNLPRYVEWDKNGDANISIHIDYDMFNIPVNKSKRNYAWVAESSAIFTPLQDMVRNRISFLEENYEFIFTHDKRLLEVSPKFKLTLPNAVPWIQDRKIHKKTKLVSMFASTKLYCPGHRYRQEVVKKYEHQIDCFGTGRNRVETKEIGLNDYHFSIAMENDTYPNIFCEKITDCFATGTIPIFWGTPTIGEFFNENGIIMLTDNLKIEDLSPDLYYSKMEYIEDNFERAINLLTSEDHMYENYIK